jgi:hypothetical protein
MQSAHDHWLTEAMVRRWWMHVFGMVLIILLMLATYFEVHGIASRLDERGDEWRRRLTDVQEDLHKIIKSQETDLWTLETSGQDR